MNLAGLLPSPFSRPLRVLLADDTAANRHLFSAFLSRLGCEVDLACDGQEALEHFDAKECDLVLLDVEMPRLGGLAAARALRHRLKERWLPIVFLTTLEGEQEFIEGLDAGGDDYLVKPVTLTVLAARMRALVRSLTLHRAMEDAKNRERAITDTLVEGVLVVNERGHVEACNPAALKMFGYERAELVGLHLSQLMPARYRAAHNQAMERSTAGAPSKIIGVRQRELVGERKDGSWFALELGVNELRQGEERLLVGICRDITLRKVVDAQVRSDASRIEALCYEQSAGQDLALEVMQRQADRPSLKDPCLHALSLPAARFSGEVAAAVRGPGQRLIAMVADATGYGLSAAVSLMPLLTVFHEYAGRSSDLEELLAHLRRVAQASLPRARSVMLTLVSIDALQGWGEVFVAGMPPALVLTVDGRLREQLDARHAPLGLDGPVAPPYRLELAPGEQLVLASDGLLELLVNGSVDEALATLSARFEGVPPEGRVEAVRGELERAAQARHDRDDATLLLVDCAPGRVPGA